MTRLSAILLLAWAWVSYLGCSASHKSLVSSLEEIGKSDLEGILADLPPKAKGAILAKPYFVKDEYVEFPKDSAMVFQARATLVFFYLDPNLDLCQVRKYRYRTSAGFWDRYSVKLIHTPRKYLGSADQ